MKRAILTALIVIGMIGSIHANPLPEKRIEYVNAFPPEIGVMFYLDSLDISGETITTMGGSAVIGEYDLPGSFEMVIFDSSNTTGFVINPEGDIVEIPSQYTGVNFGNYGSAPPPIKGYSIRYTWGYPWIDEWSFNFTHTQWSLTNIVINEINAHGEWKTEANFIELYNQSANPLDIGSWMVVCDTICIIPPNTIIEGNGFYVIDQSDFPDTYDMDFDADNIYLIRADSVLVDQVGWSSDHGANVSFMRYPDGEIDTTLWEGYAGYNDQSSCTFENGFPSRGAPNRHSSPSFVVIGAHACNESGNVDVRWTDPIWEPVFDYSVVVRSFAHYPQDINDGDLIYQGGEQQVIDMVPPGHMIAYYTIFARDLSGNYSTPTNESRTFVILETAGVDEGSILPENISSLECYPNPFNASGTIKFVLSQAGSVTLSIYNLRGQRVETLMEIPMSAGEHRITWDGSDLPSGVYFARLDAGISSKSIKMVLLK
ncbi:MAG: lamin tail domain-containing protein [Candidatus Zixiibacteriota bacterium]|nr:MAG: lamin tail domain-containing protein [candidate division Zixibacteria bacterium]